MIYRILFPALWLVFIAFWIVMARGGKTVAEREDLYSRLSHYGPLAIAVYLLVAPDALVPILNARFAPVSLGLVQLAAALTVIGVAFAVWARLRLAGNWSSDVTLKRDHELIVDGPYRFRPPPDLHRHPGRPDRNGTGGRRVARRRRRRPGGRRLVAQADDRGSRDAPPVRRRLYPLRRADAGADPVRAVGREITPLPAPAGRAAPRV